MATARATLTKPRTTSGAATTSSALDRLRRQLASTTQNRTTSGFGTASAPRGTSTTRQSTGGYTTQAGFGGRSAPAPVSKLGGTSPQAQSIASTFANYSPAQTQSFQNQLAAATGGAMGTPAAPTVAGTTPPVTTPGATTTQGTGTATTPFGKSFTPDSAEMMRNNPDALIAAYYNFIGASPNGGEQAMSQEMNAERLRLLNVLFGNQGVNAGNFYPYADWSGGFLGRQRTPGAATYSTQDILNRMLTTDKNDPIWAQLNGAELTPDMQADRWISAYSTANAGNMDPYVMNARQSRLVQLQNEFIAAKGQGKLKDKTFTQYLDEMGFV
jgi:hypothetical protein